MTVTKKLARFVVDTNILEDTSTVLALVVPSPGRSIASSVKPGEPERRVRVNENRNLP